MTFNLLKSRIFIIGNIFVVLSLIISSIILPVYADTTSGLITHIKFDSNANDSSGNGNNGTAYGITYQNGIENQAGVFDGNTDYVSLNDVGDLGTGSMTFSTWFKTNSDEDSYRNIFMKTDGNWGTHTDEYYRLTVTRNGISTPNKLQFEIADGDEKKILRSYQSINDNEWYFVVITIDRSTNLMTMYIDSAPEVSTDISTLGSWNLTQNFMIGCHNNGENQCSTLPQTNHFEGLIDDIRMYNRVLTRADISQLYFNDSNYENGNSQANNVPDGVDVQVITSNGGTASIVNGNSGSISVGGTNEVVYLKDSNGFYVARVVIDMSVSRDFSSIVALTQGSGRKVTVKNIASLPGVVGGTYDLLAYRRDGDSRLIVCPHALTPDEVWVGCPDGEIFDIADVTNGTSRLVRNDLVTVTKEILPDDREYWVVSGVSGTGAQSLSGNLTIVTPSNGDLDSSLATEVTFQYTRTLNYSVGDTIVVRFDPGFSANLTNCNTPTNNVDGDASVDGSFTELTSGRATYTFTSATTSASSTGIQMCLKVPANQLSGTQALILNDSNFGFGAVFLYVNGDNDIIVTAEVSLELSQNIRNIDDTADTNACYIGRVNTASIPDYDDVVDIGQGECGYGIAVESNHRGGFTTSITSNGLMASGTNTIPYISNGGTFAGASTAVFGIARVIPSQTGANGNGGFNSVITLGSTPGFSYGTNVTTTAKPVPISPALATLVTHSNMINYDESNQLSTDLTKVINGIRITSSTPAGVYTQIQSIYTSPNF